MLVYISIFCFAYFFLQIFFLFLIQIFLVLLVLKGSNNEHCLTSSVLVHSFIPGLLLVHSSTSWCPREQHQQYDVWNYIRHNLFIFRLTYLLSGLVLTGAYFKFQARTRIKYKLTRYVSCLTSLEIMAFCISLACGDLKTVLCCLQLRRLFYLFLCLLVVYSTNVVGLSAGSDKPARSTVWGSHTTLH